MTVLAVGKPLEQAQSELLVENKLAAGRHRFSLVVVNARGVASDPDVLVLTVGRSTVIGPRGARGGAAVKTSRHSGGGPTGRQGSSP